MEVERAQNAVLSNSGSFINKLYRKLYIATALSFFLRTSVQFIGSFLAGNLLGPTALGTVGLLMPFSFIYIALGAFYEIGCTTLCSKYIGEHDFDSAKKAVTVAFVSNALICALLAVLGLFFMDDILHALNIPAEIFVEARTYATIYLALGFFVSTVSIGCGLFQFDGYGNALKMITGITPLCALMVIYVLIQYAGFGVSAVAAGICAGYALSAVIMLYMFAAKTKVLGFI